MSLLLVFQPGAPDATDLSDLLREQVSGEIVVADSIEVALSTIDRRIPDVILLPTLIAAEEDYLMAYLATIPRAGHVQAVRVPLLERTAVTFPAHSRFWSQRRRSADPASSRCSPRAFARDVETYLARAHMLRDDFSRRGAAATSGPERRGRRRWGRDEVPFAPVVRLAGGDEADLINVSSGGALLRTRFRPDLRFLRRPDPTGPERPRLTFRLKSGGEVQAAGRVVRCCAGPAAAARLEYEVAFSFDESVGLELPDDGALIRADEVRSAFGTFVRDDDAWPRTGATPDSARFALIPFNRNQW